MANVLVAIRRLRHEQLKLAQDAFAAIKGDRSIYGVTRIVEMQSAPDEVGAEMVIGGEAPGKVAKAAVWKSLANLMQERGIIFKSTTGRTDAIGNQAAVTEDQLEVVVLTLHIRTSAQVDCGGVHEMDTALMDFDAARREVEQLMKDPTLLCIQIYEVPTDKFQAGWCRPNATSRWSECGVTELRAP